MQQSPTDFIVDFYFIVLHARCVERTVRRMYRPYRVQQNKVAPRIFYGFLSNCLEFQREIVHTYLVIISAFNSRISI